MNSVTNTQDSERDAAWASVITPLSVDELRSFCNDIERLFRINPMLEFKNWEVLGDSRFRIVGLNHSQEPGFEFETELSVEFDNNTLRIHYDQGIKSNTEILIEQDPKGSKITITDYYERLPEDEKQDYLNQVDKSLSVWAQYLQQFLIHWKRWSKISLWRWYMKRIWQPMKPSGRRITFMILLISVIEVALIALGATIYYLEYT